MRIVLGSLYAFLGLLGLVVFGFWLYENSPKSVGKVILYKDGAVALLEVYKMGFLCTVYVDNQHLVLYRNNHLGAKNSGMQWVQYSEIPPFLDSKGEQDHSWFDKNCFGDGE